MFTFSLHSLNKSIWGQILSMATELLITSLAYQIGDSVAGIKSSTVLFISIYGFLASRTSLFNYKNEV